MTTRIHTRSFRITLTLALAVLGLTAAQDAYAACFTSPLKTPVVQPRAQALRNIGQTTAFAQGSESSAAGHQIVGMWASEFRTAAGLWDQGLELFHADGTEVAIDNAVPPSLGNVCIGVWKSAGPRTIRLRHMTFNWNTDGTVAGTFLLLVTATVSPDGRTYDGTFVSDSYDVQGTVIPALHAEGTVRGTRITVD